LTRPEQTLALQSRLDVAANLSNEEARISILSSPLNAFEKYLRSLRVYRNLAV
jgi:hypothetical protein